MHLLTKGTPFNDLSEGCAVRIKISLYFQKRDIREDVSFFAADRMGYTNLVKITNISIAA